MRTHIIAAKELSHKKLGRSIESGEYEVVSNKPISDELVLALGKESGWTGQLHYVQEKKIVHGGWRAVAYWKCDSSD